MADVPDLEWGTAWAGDEMITLEDYFGKWIGHPDANVQRKIHAQALLECVNALLFEYPEDVPVNPQTNSYVSGATYGGFRPQDCPQGAPNSSHKEGMAIDIYDPHGDRDKWLTDDILEEYGLYREHPDHTIHWCHLSIRAPGSGKRTFLP